MNKRPKCFKVRLAFPRADRPVLSKRWSSFNKITWNISCKKFLDSEKNITIVLAAQQSRHSMTPRKVLLLTLILMTEPLLASSEALFLGPEVATFVQGDKASPARQEPLSDGDGLPLPSALSPVAPHEGALEWAFTAPAAGRYLITLEASHSRSGNPFEIQVADQVLKGFMPGTRNSVALVEAGAIDLTAVHHTLRLSNLPSSENVYLSAYSIFLRPESTAPMSLPAIRAEIAKRKPVIPSKELAMPRVFSNHMVLQRQMKVPVWGRAVPNATVKVSFNGQVREGKADASGRWRVDLDPMEAGGPHRLEVSDSKKTIAFDDVLIGEVWFGSGQSNMEVSYNLRKNNELKVECDEDTRQLLEAGANNAIRISALTRDHSQNAAWAILTKENCLDAPALLSSAAVLLNQKLGVPIGIVIRCESSSPSCIWLSRDAIEGDSAIQAQLADYAKNAYPKLVSEHPVKVKAWEEASAKAKAEGKPAPKAPLPPTPPGCYPGEFDPATQRREYHGANFAARIQSVPPFAIRGIVWDQGENGTGMAGVDQSTLLPALVREWRTAWDRPDLPFIYIDKKMHPPGLKEAMATLSNTAMVPYEGLKTDNHPPDKAAYARRLVEQMEK